MDNKLKYFKAIPSINSKALYRVKNNTTIEFLSESGNWLKTSIQNYTRLIMNNNFIVEISKDEADKLKELYYA